MTHTLIQGRHALLSRTPGLLTSCQWTLGGQLKVHYSSSSLIFVRRFVIFLYHEFFMTMRPGTFLLGKRMAMEFSILNIIFNIYILYALPVRAQTGVSSAVWVVPDGDTADLSKTYTEGITLQVTWNPVPEGYKFNTLSNLWVTTWDYQNTQFSQLLTENVNTNNSGTYDWTITIPTKILSKDAKYVLRFKDLSSVYNASSQEVSSTGFLVIDGGSSSSSTTSSGQTSSTISSSQTSSSASSTSSASTVATSPVTSSAGIATPSATSSSTPTSEDNDNGLSGGAKAGIAVGIVVAALLIAGLAFYIFRRRRNAKSTSTRPPTDLLTEPSVYYDPPKQYFTGNTTNVVAEIGGRERVELQGS
ncbi:7d7e955f-a179-4254-ac7d-c655278a3655 [Sclerotinia trifoliorum]|uniref:7d7e955f-a179-4254-ac7d-c655278a3655 n=1 Tax=Sclerotinia trifoliorum TaxID=28548 RepID=A0A8H2W207_9HELO|nr:7d7e955f-a179-4254-ac7d-c655278a3655 [Sclerotinia trifoliorum]